MTRTFRLSGSWCVVVFAVCLLTAACDTEGGVSAAPDTGSVDAGESPVDVAVQETSPDIAAPETTAGDTNRTPQGEDAEMSAETADPVDAVQPETVAPGGCCESDAACAPGEQCIGLAIGSPGVCLPVPPAGECYERRDCGEDEACAGGRATICVMSSLPDLGDCVAMPDHCCWENADCDDGRQCEGANEASWGPGECLLVPDAGQCFRDEHCADGTVCLGAQPCGCLVDCYWAGPGRCVPEGGPCCFFDDHCAEGLHCVGGGLGGAPGVCKPALDDGTCWGALDCAQGQSCEGAQICPCDALCDMEDQPGVCTSGEECCETDADCPAGWTCASLPAALGLEGACKPEQMAGMCWDHDDCAATEACVGANPCACGASGEGDGCDIPGTCSPLPATCCFADAHCPEGQVCVDDGLAGGAPGKCVTPVDTGCWRNEDCSDGRVCQGEMICGCDVWCDAPDEPGTCVTGGPYDCCLGPDDCAAGLVCAPLYAGAESGVCKPAAEAGSCWINADCATGELCVGAQVCPCNADCDMEDTPGTCQPVGGGCCTADADCGRDQICAPGGACERTPVFGECWTDDDCSFSQTCSGVVFCPCAAGCLVPSAPGRCAPLPSGCCYGDDGCDDGFVCRAYLPEVGGLPGRCVPDPSGPACPGDFACCWNDADCGDGGTCENEYVCGCIDLCPMCGACADDQMGACR